MSKIRLWFVIPVCILMVGFLFGSAWTDFHQAEDFKHNGVKTFGIITKQDFAGRSGENIYVDYEYVVGESIYEAYGEWIANDEYGVTLEEGTIIEVYYLPSDPSKSLVVGNDGNSKSLTYGGLMALVVSGLLILPRSIPLHWRRKRIAKVIINVRWLIAISFVPFALAFILYFETLDQRLFNQITLIVIGTPILIAVYLFLYFVSRLRRERHSVQGAIARQTCAA